MLHAADDALVCSALGTQVSSICGMAVKPSRWTFPSPEHSPTLCVSTLATSLCWTCSQPRTRALSGSLDCLNELLEYDGCDVDYTNQLEGLTPLHFAVKVAEPALRALIVDTLLDAGADTRLRATLVCSLITSILTTVLAASGTRLGLYPSITYPKTIQKHETLSNVIRPNQSAYLRVTLRKNVRVP
jgi:hypothetical protein